MSEKTCTKCKETKPESEFYPRYGSRKGTLNPHCKKCHGKYGTASRSRTPEAKMKYAKQMRGYWLKRKFGLSHEDYAKMLASQHGVCALCKTRPNRIVGKQRAPRQLAVDHDHETGQVRGLLCDTCNRGLGLLKDNPTILRIAAEYVEKHKLRNVV